LLLKLDFMQRIARGETAMAQEFHQVRADARTLLTILNAV
jgi:hypothetical protein